MNIIHDAMQNQLFELFLAIMMGYAIARLKFNRMVFGTVGVLITAIILGVLGFQVPPAIKTLGFLVFIYAVGIQSGPRIFSIFKKKNFLYLIIGLVIFLTVFVVTYGVSKLFGLSRELFAGLVCGMFGHASALANLVTLYDAKMSGFSFSIMYPISLIADLLFVMFLIKKLRIVEKPGLDGDFSKGVNIKDERIIKEPILVRNDDAANGEVTLPRIEDDYGVIITEIVRGEKVEIPSPETVLHKGDVVITEGYKSDVDKFRDELGDKARLPDELLKGLQTRQILITNRDIDGKTIGELEIRKKYRCVITRIWRSGMFIAAPESKVELEVGDSVVMAGPQKGLIEVTKLLGQHDKSAGEIDFFSMGFVITMGLLLGAISFKLPGLAPVKLGMVGGVLLISLLVGYSRRIGFVSGQMSPAARAILRDLGITFFIISVGTEAGALFLKTEFSEISRVFIASMIINIIVLAGIAVIIRVLRMRSKAATVLSVFTGVITCTPAMGLLVSETGNEEFMIPFASVYPIAQVVVIVFSQIVFLLY